MKRTYEIEKWSLRPQESPVNFFSDETRNLLHTERQLKSKVQPNTSDVEVRAFKQTKDAVVLVKIEKGASDQRVSISQLKTTLSDDSKVQDRRDHADIIKYEANDYPTRSD